MPESKDKKTPPAPVPLPSPTPAQEQSPAAAPAPPLGGARHSGALEVLHDMVGRFVRGHVLHATEIAEFAQERLDELLARGALRPLDQTAKAPPARPVPEEDAALAAEPQPPVQDFDRRSGGPRAG